MELPFVCFPQFNKQPHCSRSHDVFLAATIFPAARTQLGLKNIEKKNYAVCKFTAGRRDEALIECPAIQLGTRRKVTGSLRPIFLFLTK